MSDWERAICARVKTARESINWSQASFAEQLGITRDQLASIEYGRTPLRYNIAWRLRLAFGISLHSKMPPKNSSTNGPARKDML